MYWIRLAIEILHGSTVHIWYNLTEADGCQPLGKVGNDLQVQHLKGICTHVRYDSRNALQIVGQSWNT